MRRILFALAAVVLAGVLVSPTPALALGAAHTIAGPVISYGADGRLLTLTCPVLEHTIGGGYKLTAQAGLNVESWDFRVSENRPTDNALGWQVAVKAVESDDLPANIQAFVACTT